MPMLRALPPPAVLPLARRSCLPRADRPLTYFLSVAFGVELWLPAKEGKRRQDPRYLAGQEAKGGRADDGGD